MISLLSQLQIAALLSTMATLTALFSGGSEAAGVQEGLARVRGEQ